MLTVVTTYIEENDRYFGLGGYFMAALLAAASYFRIGFSLYFAIRARHVRVPGGSKFHLEPGTIRSNILNTTKRAKYKICHYSTIVQGCINTCSVTKKLINS